MRTQLAGFFVAILEAHQKLAVLSRADTIYRIRPTLAAKEVNLMPKAKKVVHKFKPNVQVIQSSMKAVIKLNMAKLVIADVVKGTDYEEIAVKRGISPEEARALSKQAIARWAGDLGHTATEAKALDLRRADAVLERLHPLVFPEPYLDNETGLTVTPPIDLVAAKMYKDYLEYRAKMLGTEAAHKLAEERTEILRREYHGIASNARGEIDL